MFKSTHPNQIESDEGFSIQVIQGGQGGIIYREGNRAIKILSDTAVDPVGYIIYSDSIRKWAPPESGDDINENVRERIVNNLRKAFLFQGYKINVNDTSKFQQWMLNNLQRLE